MAKVDILDLDIKAPPPGADVQNREEPAPRFADGTGGVPALRTPRLEVRYESAADFVQEYASNLSNGGLFLHGNYQLAPLSDVDVNIVMPGQGSIVTRCRIVHCASGGLGLDLARGDRQLEAALLQYLVRLGKRRELLVACSPELKPRLDAAGYQVLAISSPADVIRALTQGLDVAVVAVHADEAHEVESMIDSDFVAAYRDFDELLALLDRRL